jgi:hypothetical protein
MEKEKLIQIAIERKEFTYLEDGFLYWFPSNKGGVSSWQLRAIADYLDEKNKQWEKQISEYFSINKI